MNINEILYELEENIKPEIERWIVEYEIHKYTWSKFMWEKFCIYWMLWNYIIITVTWNVIVFNNLDSYPSWDSICCALQNDSRFEINK